jgi:prevent-host-death family protein
MTEEIGVRELKERASEVVKRVREQQATYDVTYRGKVVAHIVPAGKPRMTEAEEDRLWAEIDELAEEIGKHWPKGVSAVDAVREQRR